MRVGFRLQFEEGEPAGREFRDLTSRVHLWVAPRAPLKTAPSVDNGQAGNGTGSLLPSPAPAVAVRPL